MCTGDDGITEDGGYKCFITMPGLFDDLGPALCTL